MNMAQRPLPDLHDLVDLFYADPAELGQFEAVIAEQMPDVYRGLLAHDEHMTVTVESYHHTLVDVQVLGARHNLPYYSRKILLTRQTDGRVVQFGIVRLRLDYLSREVQQEILSERTPLGRVLIENNVLREVELVGLWKICCGPDLAALFDREVGTVTYGRTALLHLNGEPAVELLEIVTPE